jgi:hypothetical protein
MQSDAQRRYLWANEPDVAKKFEKETPKGAKLPEKKKTKASLSVRIADLELAVLALARVEFGDTPGHDFHGNQHTGGQGGTVQNAMNMTRAQKLSNYEKMHGIAAAFAKMTPQEQAAHNAAVTKPDDVMTKAQQTYKDARTDYLSHADAIAEVVSQHGVGAGNALQTQIENESVDTATFNDNLEVLRKNYTDDPADFEKVLESWKKAGFTKSQMANRAGEMVQDLAATHTLEFGDVAGHAFHGNQYSDLAAATDAALAKSAGADKMGIQKLENAKKAFAEGRHGDARYNLEGAQAFLHGHEAGDVLKPAMEADRTARRAEADNVERISKTTTAGLKKLSDDDLVKFRDIAHARSQNNAWGQSFDKRLDTSMNKKITAANVEADKRGLSMPAPPLHPGNQSG